MPPVGNVGIGTLNPQKRLQVNGKMQVDSSLLVLDSVVFQKDARVMENMRVDGETTLLGDTKIEGVLKLPNLIEETDTSNLKVMLVKTDGTVAMASFSTIDPNPPVDDNTHCDPGLADDILPKWRSGQDKIYTPCPDTKVGIGTTSPRVRLDVSGKTYTERMFVGNIDPSITLPENYFYLKAHYTDPNLSRRLFIIENGNRTLFEVNNTGLLRSREILIDAVPWSDYVFEDQYPLMPLLEVAEYIRTNKHLPEIPSEKEVQEHGINVGEMQSLLLKKIEELTLYIIEQDKRIEELEKAVK